MRSEMKFNYKCGIKECNDEIPCVFFHSNKKFIRRVRSDECIYNAAYIQKNLVEIE